jgi:mannose-6-phosphate isomerase-like protein (cupin superfamily)
MKLEKVVVADKLKLITEYWNPKNVGGLNGQLVKLVKLKGEFIWHKHENEDELFWVINGDLDMEIRGQKTITVSRGEFIIIPRGTEHRPVAKNEVEIMLFEPESTLNTGDQAESRLTRNKLDWI